MPGINIVKDEEITLHDTSAIGSSDCDRAAADEIKNYTVLMHIKRMLTACERWDKNTKGTVCVWCMKNSVIRHIKL